MSVHAICPSARCRKIVTFEGDVRGRVVTCRYCEMQFRVPQVRRPHDRQPGERGAAGVTPDEATPSRFIDHR